MEGESLGELWLYLGGRSLALHIVGYSSPILPKFLTRRPKS